MGQRSRSHFFPFAAVALLVFAAVFGFLFIPIAVSQDEWWHLKTGKWIWEHGLRPPRNDIFAYTSSDYAWANPKPYRWDNHEWLAQVAMYGVYALGETTGFGPMRAVIAAKTVVLLAAFLLVGWFAWRRSNSLAFALLLTVVAAAIGRHTMQPRPPVISYLFVAAFQFVLWAYRNGRLRARWLLSLPPAMALWANLHGGFVLGGIVLACYFAGEAAEYSLARWARRRGARLGIGESGNESDCKSDSDSDSDSDGEGESGRLRGPQSATESQSQSASSSRSASQSESLSASASESASASQSESVSVSAVFPPPSPPSEQDALRRARTLLGIGLLCALCSLATPFGWRLYLLSHRVMSDKTLAALIWELQPPRLGESWAYVGLSAFLVVAGMARWRRVFVGEGLWVAFLFVQSSLHQRHLPLFGVAAAPLACELAVALRGRLGYPPLPPRKQGGSRAAKRGGSWAARAMDWAALLAAAGLSLGWLTRHPIDAGVPCASHLDGVRELLRGHAYSIDYYPVRLADFIEDADFHGRMFNDSRYAGYLIWRFSPERHQVFTDMRYDIFGGDFLAEEMAVRRGQITLVDADGTTGTLDWRTVFRKWNVNFAILDKLEGRDSPRPILPDLQASKDWTLVYRDPGSRGLVTYLKNSADNADLLARCRRLAPDGLYRRPGRAPWGR